MQVSVWRGSFLGFALLCSTGAAWSMEKVDAESFARGQALFEKHCAHCHEKGSDLAPPKPTLQLMRPMRIYRTLTDGPMRAMASDLSDDERRSIAEFLTHRRVSGPDNQYAFKECRDTKPWFDYSQRAAASGWGLSNTQNVRFTPAAAAGLTPASVKKLRLKWAFGFPNTDSPRSQPAIAGGALFVGDQDGNLYALDAKSGCMHWRFQAENDVRTAIAISDWEGTRERPASQAPTLYFGDGSVFAYAVNAVTGELIWKRKTDNHPFARITGSITLHQAPGGSRVYVPVSSGEETAAVDPNYPCCSFRGSVTALNAATGEVIWKTYTIAKPPAERYRNARGVPQLGPSGAGVWNSPTIDSARGVLYIGTGENNSSPTENGGAVMAINLSDGSIAWSFQGYPDEAYNAACQTADRLSCPREFKGRFGLDVSASPMLMRGDNGRDMVVAIQKTGDIYGLDPNQKGKVVWRRRISRGDYNLAGLFGMAAEGRTVFAGLFDLRPPGCLRQPWPGTGAYVRPCDPPEEGADWSSAEELGVYALDGFTGAPVWMAPVMQQCSSKSGSCRGYRAALTAAQGVVFAGAMDGYLRALDSATGELLWEFNTADKFNTLNGMTAQGGSIGAAGAVVANGMVYINSGYGVTGQPGNVLLAFSVDGK